MLLPLSTEKEQRAGRACRGPEAQEPVLGPWAAATL